MASSLGLPSINKRGTCKVLEVHSQVQRQSEMKMSGGEGQKAGRSFSGKGNVACSDALC